MAETSWLKSRFGNLSKLFNKAKGNLGPTSSTPFAYPIGSEPKTPTAPPYPDNSPVREGWGEGMPDRHLSLSEPNIAAASERVLTRQPRYARYNPRGIVLNHGAPFDSDASSSDRHTPIVEEGEPQGLAMGPTPVDIDNNKSNTCNRDTQTTIIDNKPMKNVATDTFEREHIENTPTYVPPKRNPVGYQPPSSYHVPPRNIVREGERYVTFEDKPEPRRVGLGRSREYSFRPEQHSGAFNQFKRREEPVFDPSAYRDLYYDQDAEMEKLWKHLSANQPGGSAVYQHTPNASNTPAYQPTPRAPDVSKRPMTFTSKPPKFNGSDWEGYLLQFNSCAVANDWDDEQSVKYLASSLTGDAVYVLAQKPVRAWTFTELCDALEERYGLTNSAFVNRSKLRRIAQHQGQTIQQVADEILKLVRCSFSAPPREHDRIAVDYFIDAISDPDLKRHLMQNEPHDIRAAVVLAKKFEEIQLATRPRVNPRVFVTKEESDRGQASEESAKLKQLCEEINRLRARQADLENKLSQSEARARQNIYADPHPNTQRGHGYNNKGKGYNPNNQGFNPNNQGHHPNNQGHHPNNQGGRTQSDNPNWRRQDGQA